MGDITRDGPAPVYLNQGCSDFMDTLINYDFVGQDNITAEWEDSGYSIPYALGYSGTIYF